MFQLYQLPGQTHVFGRYNVQYDLIYGDKNNRRGGRSGRSKIDNCWYVVLCAVVLFFVDITVTVVITAFHKNIGTFIGKYKFRKT